MPHSLRAKLSGLRYKGILEDKDYKRLCKALDNEKVLDKIKEIVVEWESDTWTDDFSYDCMRKISDIVAESEG